MHFPKWYFFVVRIKHNMSFQMIELIANTGVYLHPKELRVASKKANGTAIARYLLSAFYTNQELVDAGNITGVNGEKGINKINSRCNIR